jgi:hypothetical protein
MHFLPQQSQELILTLLKKLFKIIFRSPLRCRVGKGGHQRFLPFGRTNIAGHGGLDASLQDICSGQPQLHTLCLSSINVRVGWVGLDS